MTMIKKKILKIFEDIKKKNDEIIEKSDSILSVCCLIKKDYSLDLIGFRHRNYEEKIMYKEMLKKIIISQKIYGYILIQDVKMTTINKKTNETKIQDAVIRQLYTPKEKIIEAVIYKDKRILKKMDLSDGETEWNIWGKGLDIDDKIVKEYNQIKKDNPEDYKDVV